ncbi:GMC family oxidoreductase N-terminal domain-containing protein [Alloacidobacterium dinghuense]|uniref:GMC family oxidoreductase N-terminal domain-containing protein n=1 Tax=Alloacidobacterium dinghuense TaxID=2763107 RepID=A0A7G8BGH7_9BACT|nr:FAD-dependent oxidoreductase [Alloacidobacterium dinghuense]QNI31647.1 GMC family oxidoreductase N-terminal domain-containing protein [Alloacidobacterium dinghuense]
MIHVSNEKKQFVLDQLSTGRLDRRKFFSILGAAAATSIFGPSLNEALAANANQIERRTSLQAHYDYIVVGAGSAGSVLAAELSKSGAQVLLVESGGPDDAPTIANPSIWFYNVGGPLDYHLPLEPLPQLNNRKFNMALGHVLGGGGSINGMVWTRGMQRDYDGWEKSGAKGWAFVDVLPVFKSQEDWEGGANSWRGAGGPIHIRRPGDPHPTAPAFVEAAREMGMPILDDVNGPMRAGAGFINMNIAADGTRVSAVRALLRPELARPNLTLLLNTNVVKLNFKGTRCVGVKLITEGVEKDIAASKDVVLTAGSIHTPKLLMLSGVGEAKALQGLGIEIVENLPGVGANLQDHVLVSGVVFKYKGKMPKRPADSDAVEAEAYLSSGSSGDTDINLVLEQLPAVTPEAAARFGAPPDDAFTIAPALVQPTSRGSVRLASNRFQDAAVVNGNYLGTDQDFAAIVRAIEAARELGNQHAFDGVREIEVVPGPKATSEDIRELARLGSASFGHAVGTCKIGVDELAVVDPKLRVHGLENLRVADASVMPRIITGPTNAPTHMIAGRAAKFILS